MNSKCNPANVGIGVVSWSKEGPRELIPAFMDALDDFRETLSLPGPTTRPAEDTASRCETVGKIDDFLGDLERRIVREGYYDSDEALDDWDKLIEWLEQFAPPYLRFGRNEGVYGYWLDSEQIDEDAHAGELERGDETPEPSERPDGSLYLHVNERGNCELYSLEDGAWISVWSCV